MMKFLGYVSTAVLLVIVGFCIAHFDVIDKIIKLIIK